MVVKITSDNLSAKVGKRVDIRTVTEISLPNKQIEEFGTFIKLEALEKIDLSGNWIKFTRQIDNLFHAPNLKEIILTGNTICKIPNYRKFVINSCPKLVLLDGVEVTEQERKEAEKFYLDQTDPDALAKKEEDRKKEEEAAIRNKQLDEAEKKRIVQQQYKVDQVEWLKQEQKKKELEEEEKRKLKEYLSRQRKEEGLEEHVEVTIQPPSSPRREYSEPVETVQKSPPEVRKPTVEEVKQAPTQEVIKTPTQEVKKTEGLRKMPEVPNKTSTPAKQTAVPAQNPPQKATTTTDKAPTPAKTTTTPETSTKTSPAKQTTPPSQNPPVKAPTASAPQKKTEMSTPASPQKFTDARSGLHVTDRFNSLFTQDDPEPEEVKRTILTEDSLFGTSKTISLNEKSAFDSSLFSKQDDDDLFKQFEAPKKKRSTKKTTD